MYVNFQWLLPMIIPIRITPNSTPKVWGFSFSVRWRCCECSATKRGGLGGFKFHYNDGLHAEINHVGIPSNRVLDPSMVCSLGQKVGSRPHFLTSRIGVSSIPRSLFYYVWLTNGSKTPAGPEWFMNDWHPPGTSGDLIDVLMRSWMLMRQLGWHTRQRWYPKTGRFMYLWGLCCHLAACSMKTTYI